MLGGRFAPGEALERIFRRFESGRPGLVGKRRIGDDVIVGAELLAALKQLPSGADSSAIFSVSDPFPEHRVLDNVARADVL